MAAEKQFEQKLKKWLESEGIYSLGTPSNKMTVEPCGYWLKRWGGGKFTQSGLPDMQIVVNGLSIECELKAPNGRPSELQKFMIKQINESHGIGVILYPKDFEKFKSFVRTLKERGDDHGNFV